MQPQTRVTAWGWMALILTLMGGPPTCTCTEGNYISVVSKLKTFMNNVFERVTLAPKMEYNRLPNHTNLIHRLWSVNHIPL